ncbi:MAG TPA: ribosome silencing factor [Candidatus Krumholzibacterium sp.]|nr:ribosome silencing factor [Candidatus Krumholzibacterium sp.]
MATAPKTLAKQIIRASWDKKAEDIVLLNLKKLSNMADYLVIMSAGSDVQARVIADHILQTFKGREVVVHTEGYEAGNWILIDCFSVIVHIFRPEVRKYYGLEKLWGDAPREEFPDGL